MSVLPPSDPHTTDETAVFSDGTAAPSPDPNPPAGAAVPDTSADAFSPGGEAEANAAPAPAATAEHPASLQEAEAPRTDYADLAAQDMAALRRAFPECMDMEGLWQLERPLRYAELRDMGLSPEEAYLATTHRHPAYDNRRHLQSSVPRAAAGPAGMSASEMAAARELFEGLTDAELSALYRRVAPR